MSIATILPFVPAQWFTSAGDAVLAGGQLWFYEVGTSTPKSVFADYEMSAALPNPVVLNGAGKANIFLGAGGYKVVLCDALGAVMDTVDGVFADPTSVGGGTVQTGIATFADLRSFPNPGAVVTVVVGGALAQGDGGGGLFTFDPTITTTDDGGVFIAPNFGIGRWVRSVSGIPSISWWGVKGLTTESDDGAIANAFAYCNSRNYSIIIDRENVGIRTDKVFSGSKMIFSGGFFYTGAFAPTLAFGDGATVQADPHDQIMIGVGSILYGDGQVFSPEWTSPILDDNAIQIAVTSIGTKYGRMVISSPYACTGNVALLASTELDFDEGGRLNFSAAANLDIPNLVYAGDRQVASWASVANVGTIRFGSGAVKPEWFGAVGDGVTNDATALQAATHHGAITGKRGAAYRATVAISCGSVRFESTEAHGSNYRPLFDFDAGLTVSVGGRITANNALVRIDGGTVRAVAGDGLGLIVGGVALNGPIDLVRSRVTAESACSTDSEYLASATDTDFVAAEKLPLIRWILHGGSVTGSTGMALSRAYGSEIECRVFANTASGERAILNGCSVTNASYFPTISAETSTQVDAVGCRFLSTAPVPAEHGAWATSEVWRFPMSDGVARVTYSGCTQNGGAVFDPYAVAIDSDLVEYARGTSSPVAYAQWHGIPSGVSASGSSLAIGSTLNVTEPIEDGSTWTTTGWSGAHSSFANDFGFVMATVQLVSSNPGAYIDLLVATAPAYLNKADYPGSGWPPFSYLVRNVSPKSAIRVMAGQSLILPVWIGAGDTVAAGGSSSGQVDARITTTKMQMQIIRWNAPAGSSASVSIREGVVTNKRIFDALYNKPDLTPVSVGSFQETGYPRFIDAVTYLGMDTKSTNGPAKLFLRGNDMRYTSGHVANDGRYFTWRPISSSQLETIIGETYSRGGPTNVAPVSPGAEVYRSGNPNGALLSFDIDETTGFTGYRILSASNVVD